MRDKKKKCTMECHVKTINPRPDLWTIERVLGERQNNEGMMHDLYEMRSNANEPIVPSMEPN